MRILILTLLLLSTPSFAADLLVDINKPNQFNDGTALPEGHISGYWVYIKNKVTQEGFSRYLEGEDYLSAQFTGLDESDFQVQVEVWSVTGCRGILSDVVEVTVVEAEKPIAKVNFTAVNPVTPPEDPNQLCIDDPDCEVTQ